MKKGSVPKYDIVIYWDHDDMIFVAEVPDLPGCIAHGTTRTKAAEQVSQAIDLWLETAQEFGNKIPEPRRHQLAA